MNAHAIQDTFSDNHCIGCGPDNDLGLRIKSMWCGDLETECYFHPEGHMTAAPSTVLNGGIIATLIDCHSVCTAVGYGRRLDGLHHGEPGPLFATGSMEIKYLRPARIDRPVHLRAKISGLTGTKTVVVCTLHSDGALCAEATVVAFRVPHGWGSQCGPRGTQRIPAPNQSLGGLSASSDRADLAKTA